MCIKKSTYLLSKVFSLICLVFAQVAFAEEVPRIGPDGTIKVVSFDLPESAYLSDETRAALKRYRDVTAKELVAAFGECPAIDKVSASEAPSARRCRAEAFYTTNWYKNLVNRYKVKIEAKTIGGVFVEEFTPIEGVASDNNQRILINLHGGAFISGAVWFGRIESLPVASLGKFRVVSVDYRQAPDHNFPAASEDVAAVYRELLKQYKPENIGFYGCSAGAILTAQSIAWFLEEGLPIPGAAGMNCAGAYAAIDEKLVKWVRSDSGYLSGAFMGISMEDTYGSLPYFQTADQTSPLASPGGHDQILSKFPPTLLTTGTRDYFFSDVVSTHAQLVRLGVEANLHVWEGMEHGFIANPELPESREAYEVITKFFDKHLGR